MIKKQNGMSQLIDTELARGNGNGGREGLREGLRAKRRQKRREKKPFLPVCACVPVTVCVSVRACALSARPPEGPAEKLESVWLEVFSALRNFRCNYPDRK